MPGLLVARRGPCGACIGFGGIAPIPGGTCGIWSDPMIEGIGVCATGGIVGG
jgi:hypothetical protein